MDQAMIEELAETLHRAERDGRPCPPLRHDAPIGDRAGARSLLLQRRDTRLRYVRHRRPHSVG